MRPRQSLYYLQHPVRRDYCGNHPPYCQVMLWHCRELSCLSSCSVSTQYMYQYNTCSCHLQTFTGFSVDNAEHSGDRKLVVDPVFWHEWEQPAPEQKEEEKKIPERHELVEKTWGSRGPLWPVIIQNEVEQSENSVNRQCKNSQSIEIWTDSVLFILCSLSLSP